MGWGAGMESLSPLVYKGSALRRQEDGRRGPAEQHDRIGGGDQPDRRHQHSPAGNPAGELTDRERAKELLAVPDRSTLRGTFVRWCPGVRPQVSVGAYASE
jgi:hypothetical protein